MKSSRVYGFIILILLMMVSCEKLNETIDYRSTYLGKFTFSSYSYNWSAYGVNPGEYRYSDTITFEGSIDIDKKQDNHIVINYRPENSGGYTCNGFKVYGSQIKPQLLDSGILKYPSRSSICNTSHGIDFSGRFIGTDSISFTVGSASHGGEFGQIVSGIKIK